MSIRNIVIGTWAMKLHDIPCLPNDVDIWVDNSSPNQLTQLKEYFFQLTNTFVALPEGNFYIAYRKGLNKYNFLSKVEGLDFEQSFQIVNRRQIETIDIAYLCLNDIITNKTHTGRPQDTIDINKIYKYGKFIN